jgi:hypothetical protein
LKQICIGQQARPRIWAKHGTKSRAPRDQATNGPISSASVARRAAPCWQHETPTLQEPSPRRADGIDEQGTIEKQISCLAACLRDQEAAMTCGAVKRSVIIR